MKSKPSEERKKQINRLKGFLSRDDDSINTDLVPWIKARLHILYHLEGIDPASDDNIIDTPIDDNTDLQAEMKNVEKLVQQGFLNPKGLVSVEELSQHTTTESIWLSILGKVYDVTTGQAFYGPDSGSYRFYAGRDASPCFSSGQNNEEGAAEPLEEWDGKKLMAILDWSQFYEKHETYQYLGVLAGSKYFDEEGKETEVRKIILEKAGEAKVQADKEKEEKKKARLEKKRKLQEERELKKKNNRKWILLDVRYLKIYSYLKFSTLLAQEYRFWWNVCNIIFYLLKSFLVILSSRKH